MVLSYKLASDLPYNARPEISKIFTEGFYQWLKFFSNDKKKLSLAFEHIFDLNLFYVALADNKIAGITACTNGKTSPLNFNKKILVKNLGFIKGRIAYYFLKKYFTQKPYPFDIPKNSAAIEFVATSLQFYKKGVAYSLISYIIENTPYTKYFLEVADTNTKAVNLYEKLMFKEFKRVPEKNSKSAGFDFYLYMEYNKN